MGAPMRKACPCSLQSNNLDNKAEDALKRAAGPKVNLQL
jgi:hypothetical protein